MLNISSLEGKKWRTTRLTSQRNVSEVIHAEDKEFDLVPPPRNNSRRRERKREKPTTGEKEGRGCRRKRNSFE